MTTFWVIGVMTNYGCGDFMPAIANREVQDKTLTIFKITWMNTVILAVRTLSSKTLGDPSQDVNPGAITKEVIILQKSGMIMAKKRTDHGGGTLSIKIIIKNVPAIIRQIVVLQLGRSEVRDSEELSRIYD